MPEPHLHPPQWMLDLFAEGALAPAEQSEVASHSENCRRCEAEIEACRAVISALGAIPRLQPTPGFADAVMARVQIAPKSHAVRVRQSLPHSRRGWALLGGAVAAFSAPVIAVLLWIVSHPLLTVGGVWYWGSARLQALLWSGISGAAARATGLGPADALSDVIHAFAGLPGSALAALALSLAVLVPLSGWSLIRLARTSTGGISHAH